MVGVLREHVDRGGSLVDDGLRFGGVVGARGQAAEGGLQDQAGALAARQLSERLRGLPADAQAAAAAAGDAAGAGAGPQSAASADRPADDNVVDAEFTEVKEKK